MGTAETVEQLHTGMLRACVLVVVKVQELRGLMVTGQDDAARRKAYEIVNLVGEDQARDWGLLKGTAK